MADPFSTFAGVFSTLDVSLRACKGLHDACIAYKEAPREVEQIRSTIGNVESLLRNLRPFIAEYQSSGFTIQYHETLPEAIKDSVFNIDTTLKELGKVLPHPDDVNRAKERFRWVVRKKEITELQKRMERNQIILDRGLQIVAQ